MDNVNVLYRYPLYYDIVFRRTVAPEVDFMVNVFQEYTGARYAPSSSSAAVRVITRAHSRSKTMPCMASTAARK